MHPSTRGDAEGSDPSRSHVSQNPRGAAAVLHARALICEVISAEKSWICMHSMLMNECSLRDFFFG